MGTEPNDVVVVPGETTAPAEDASTVLARYNQLSLEEKLKVKRDIALQTQMGYVGDPSKPIVDFVWKAIISAFVVILAISALALVGTMWLPTVAGVRGDPQALQSYAEFSVL